MASQSFAHGNYSHTQKKARVKGGHTPRDRARHGLSPSFLTDGPAVEQVVEAARPTGLILDPRSGTGALTAALARTGAEVVGYETDPLLAVKLKARTGFEVVKGDPTTARSPREPFAVVGNISFPDTPKIIDWCWRAPSLTSATLVTPWEYARTQSGDSGHWSQITVQSWPWFTWEQLGVIDRENFRPKPSVGSAILRIERRPEPLVTEESVYQDVVQLGFSGIGGSVHASLSTRYGGVDSAFDGAGIAHDIAAARVHPDQWITLAGLLIR
ncbi:ribosomal RNA small subunit methyltransferase A [Nocardia cyriacigeorgica]|uniref:rRNA (Adenine-N6)-methyltransferase n=1 Tax=Nocardia cyriacigeorgica TaxID=135487 RepID=A0A6P1D7N1_9NOCA|nr:rRNA adenine N-6-methyltransferase family protein [Nocardia cyriacigeorgica]NEW45609.1 rRNA (adenine-N6)-methyltransferase [Nocardia cyriacigeorgica]